MDRMLRVLAFYCRASLVLVFLPSTVTALITARLDGSNVTRAFNSPRHSRFLGNLSQWNCSQKQVRLSYIGDLKPWCDEAFETLNKTHLLQVIKGTIPVVIEDKNRYHPCSQEQMYRNVESLGASAFINLRDKLEVVFSVSTRLDHYTYVKGRYINYHSFGEPIGEGSIPFLDLGYQFYEEYIDIIRDTDPMLAQTRILVDIEGCTDRNEFEFTINTVSRWVYIFDSFLCFAVAAVALQSYRRLRTGALLFPRKLVLAIDCMSMIINGLAAFCGICKTTSLIFFISLPY